MNVLGIEKGQHWKGPKDGILLKVLLVIDAPPYDEPRKAGTVQVKRMDTGFVFWTHYLDLKTKCSLVAEADLPLLLLAL